MDILLAVLIFGVVLVPLIIIHEFGHFLAGKSIGVTILEFGIGFPPRVMKLFDWGETEFTLNALPLGGFVMPYGEDIIKPQTEEEMAASTQRLQERLQTVAVPGIVSADTPTEAIAVGGLNLKSVFEATPLQKIWFLFAGPLANFIAALVIFFFLALTGLSYAVSDVRVNEVFDASPAQQAGLQEGDIILAVNGEDFDISPDLEDLLPEDEPVTLTVQRGAERLTLTVTPATPAETLPEERVSIGAVSADSPAETAGLQEGDVILAVNGDPIETVEQLQDVTAANANIPMQVTIRRDLGQPQIVTVTPEVFEGEERARIGLLLLPLVVAENYGFVVDDQNVTSERRAESALGAGRYAVEQFGRIMTLLVTFPREIIAGNISAEEARPVSVVGVAQVGTQIAQRYGVEDLVLFTAFISISLAVTNLLPIPGLDGGRILFALIELVRGKPMSPQREGMVHLIGIGLLLSLTVLIVINDLVNPIQLP